jgi:hypothetical protein
MITVHRSPLFVFIASPLAWPASTIFGPKSVINGGPGRS